jgi:hypothetical protein
MVGGLDTDLTSLRQGDESCVNEPNVIVPPQAVFELKPCSAPRSPRLGHTYRPAFTFLLLGRKSDDELGGFTT